MKTIRLGTRGSKLALKQAEIVSNLIEATLNLKTEIIPIITSGDKIQDKPLYEVGGKSLFIKELELALGKNEIDIAIHSLKDIPGIIPDDFEIAGMLERADPRDILVSKIAKNILELPKNATIGTSAPRRIIYLNKIRPDLKCEVLRGNMDTRLGRIKAKDFDAAILAAAGFKRLYGELDADICYPIDPSVMVPAVGQGVIALEIRKDDKRAKDICDQINHKPTWDIVSVERAYLIHLNADCKTPVAAFARDVGDGKIDIDFMLGSEDWKVIVTHNEICDLKDGQKVAIMTADRLRKEIDDHNRR